MGKRKKKNGCGAGRKSSSKSDKVSHLKKILKVQKHHISVLNAKIWKSKQVSDNDELLSSDNDSEGESTSNRGHPVLMQQKQEKKK